MNDSQPTVSLNDDEAGAVGSAGDSALPQSIDRYRIERLLGKGGFGLVYLARDEALQRHVAVKVPHPKRLTSSSSADAYLQEARTVAGLDHPHIVPVYDVGSAEGCPCFVVSKYIVADSLATRMRQGPLPLRFVAELTAKVAEALHYAHKRGIVHRDVKPTNILLDAYGAPYVADFGLALREGDPVKGNACVGTPAYMSPEQARGEGHRVDGRSDVYSLGVVLYAMLVGRTPFASDRDSELLDQIANAEPRPPRQINDGVPKELERICLKALAKRASERYTTAQDMAEDLRRWLDESASVAVSSNDGASPDAPQEDLVSGGASSRAQDPIVPKGLRSFDEQDADFFLDLLPGPRDRDGLPDSVRFWKSRIEETDPDRTFAVGLLYGPSGCGKSSLFKAGVLPRLDPHVLAIYVEATPDNTENRLLRELRKRLPDLPPGLDLTATLAALRRRSGRKVLLVIDQFEQWLHAHRTESRASLVAALRQCDAGRLAAIVMVRDDFAMAASRFMHEVEARIIEGHNFATVDLFDVDHARSVLVRFGQAFGRLPVRVSQMTAEQTAFVEAATAGLARDGKVIPVRLALFAEMVKHKPWLPATLEAVGGTDGIGVNFLEETFGSRSANPDHRLHESAARSALAALLPRSGSDIKGQMRSAAELQKAAGLENRPRAFDDLLRILDLELRLITPTDPEGFGDEAVAAEDANYYQLTHDYLVPSLREWLTRKRRETWRGRAELLLADRAAYWDARPENRRLPAWWEWLFISLFASGRDRTAPQRRMMRSAGRYLAIRASLLAVAATLLALAGVEAFAYVRSQSKLDALLHAPTAEAPQIVSEMSAYRGWLDGPLRKALEEARRTGDERRQLLLSLALLPADDGQIDYLVERLLAGNPEEVLAIRSSLLPHADVVDDRLWNILEDRDAEAGRRLRAACFLAEQAPQDRRWPEVAPDLAGILAAENALQLNAWADALRPLAPSLLPALADVIVEDPDVGDRRILVELYAEFANDRSDGFAPLESFLDQPTEENPSARIAQIRRQAAAAAALAAADRWEPVWPLLRHSDDPTLRSRLIAELGSGFGDPLEIVDRIDPALDTDPSVRRALVLVLGDLSVDRLSVHERERLTPMLRALSNAERDAGLNAAAEWTLARWGATVGPLKPATDGDSPVPATTQVEPHEIVVEEPGEEPRTVRVDRRFEIGTHEVTVAEFLRFRPDHVFDGQTAVTEDCPVNSVSWYDAAAYCNWLSRQAGLAEAECCYEPNDAGDYAQGMKIKADALSLPGFRLPTAAEWELACRAGSSADWFFGDDVELTSRYAWTLSNSGLRSRPVRSLRPNDLGLFDCHGNVWEWCQDRLDDQGNDVPDAPGSAEIVLDASLRPLRGGTFLNDPAIVGCNATIRNPPGNRTGADGFRVARTVP